MKTIFNDIKLLKVSKTFKNLTSNPYFNDFKFYSNCWSARNRELLYAAVSFVSG